MAGAKTRSDSGDVGRPDAARWAGLTAKQMEQLAASALKPAPAKAAAEGEVLRMLARRGFRSSPSRPDLPFPRDFAGADADRLAFLLGHYAFRLFLRGAILQQGDFRPAEATAYVAPEKARAFAKQLSEIGLAERATRDRYRLIYPSKSFGNTLEWFVGRELRQRLGLDVATGLKFRARGLGGDLDVVATAEGKLVYLELKSSPPKHLTPREVSTFFSRLALLRPDIALFVMDTALRLSDKVLPMLSAELGGRGHAEPPAQIARELWALTPHLYAVNARPDLIGNACRAIAEGLRALSPLPPGVK